MRLGSERYKPPEEILKVTFNSFLSFILRQFLAFVVSVQRWRGLGDEVIAQLGLHDGHSRLEAFPEQGGVDGERK